MPEPERQVINPATLGRGDTILSPSPSQDPNPLGFLKRAFTLFNVRLVGRTVFQGQVSGGVYSEFQGGWIPVVGQWVYASEDSPTFVITTPSDATLHYHVGMRVRLVQAGTTKYFIITAVSATSATVYGGTDYTLTNAPIDRPHVSAMKAPLGFPLTPVKWRVIATDSSNRTQAPSAGTWYNLHASHSITIPIGVWRLKYQIIGYGTTGAGGTQADVFFTLSTANNTESNSAYTTRLISEIGASKEHGAAILKEQFETRTSKLTMYLNTKANVANMGLVGILGGTSQTEIEAVSTYL